MMDSSSKFFFSFSINYAMIVKLVDLIVLLGSKLLNRFRKIFNNFGIRAKFNRDSITNLGFIRIWVFYQLKLIVVN